MKTEGKSMKELTGYTELEWAEYMEAIQAGLIDKLLLMVSDSQLTQRQYDEIIEFTGEYVRQRCPHLLPIL